MSLPPDDQLAAQYDLGEIFERRPLGGGLFATPLFIRSSAGCFVLKPIDREAAGRIDILQAGLRALPTDGIRVPRIHLTTAGHSVATDGRASAALLDYLDGRPLDWPAWHRYIESPTALPALAAAVASLHDAMRPLAAPPLAWQRPPIQFAHLTPVVAHWEQSLNEARTEFPANETVATFVASRDLIGDAFARVLADFRSTGMSETPRQWVHGDLSPVNLMFAADTPSALIDWDFSHHGYRVYDALGDVLNRPDPANPTTRRFDPEPLRNYVGAYHDATSTPLTKAERGFIPACCIARQLEDFRQRLSVVATLDSRQDRQFNAIVRARLSVLADLLRHPSEEYT